MGAPQVAVCKRAVATASGGHQAGAGVVLISGCSTGIGRATAATLARSGYRVVATARQPETLAGLDAALILPLDVTDPASIDVAVHAVLERFGRIDVLVNNAGYALRGAIEEVDVRPSAACSTRTCSG